MCAPRGRGAQPRLAMIRYVADWVLDEVNGMRFNRFAVPGESLRLELEKEGEEDGAVRFKARARVGDAGVCRAKFSVRPRAGGNR